MSRQQREALDEMLRSTWGDSSIAGNSGMLDLGGDVTEQRRLFAEMMSAVPVPDDVVTRRTALGTVPALEVSIKGTRPSGTILYLHGGAYALGSAAASVGLASQLARRARARAVSVDYALAPESPYPAAVDNAVEAYRAILDGNNQARGLVLAGESSGGGLALAAVGDILATGLPRPAAIYLASPWVDLTTTGTSMTTKAAADPSVTANGLRRRAGDYANGHDLADARISPLFADLTGFPPILIQVGGNEILLDDATRLASRAAASGVSVTCEVTPEVPHVFVGFAGMLDEAEAALANAGAFIRANLDRVDD